MSPAMDEASDVGGSVEDFGGIWNGRHGRNQWFH
jgi:hypothetical protein